MATRQSIFSKGNARREMPQPNAAAEPKIVILSHTFTEVQEIADVLELLPLPPYSRIMGFEYVTENLPAANLTIGFMSGVFGSDDAARTSGSELFNAVAVANTVTQTAALLPLALLAAVSEAPISIGLKSSAQITPAANRKIHIRLTLAAA